VRDKFAHEIARLSYSQMKEEPRQRMRPPGFPGPVVSDAGAAEIISIAQPKENPAALPAPFVRKEIKHRSHRGNSPRRPVFRTWPRGGKKMPASRFAYGADSHSEVGFTA